MLLFSVTEKVLDNVCFIPDDGRTKPEPRKGRPSLPEPSEYKCLMRATLGKKKISTIVSLYFDSY